MAHNPRDWNTRSSNGGVSTGSPPFQSLSQRRRSSAAHTRPAGPPPSQPIPSIPVLVSFPEEQPVPSGSQTAQRGTADFATAPYGRNGPSLPEGGFGRARQASMSNESNFLPSPEEEYLSDPPPRSILHPSIYSRTLTEHQEIVPDRLLLSPPEQRAPSSRRALTRALELAREAVRLDSTNDDPLGAVMAYGRSVALLSEVLERVRRGEDSTESNGRRSGRPRSLRAQEKEVKRLKSIHDTYADRMNILSLIYSIPPIPHSPSSIYTPSMSVSSESTQPSSPTSSSPVSDSSDPSSAAHIPEHYQDDPQQRLNGHLDMSMLQGSDAETIGSAMFLMDNSYAYSNSPPPPAHPYAAPRYDSLPQPATSPPLSSATAARLSSNPPIRRPRTSSALPPPPPPPLNSPPPAPAVSHEPPPTLMVPTDVRKRADSSGHQRTGSAGRLAALAEEEMDRHETSSGQDSPQHVAAEEREEGYPADRNLNPDTPRNGKRDSHPLPPLPSPSSGRASPGTPRTAMADKPPPSPRPSNPGGIRPRGASSLSARLEPPPSQPLINQSTIMGTISQRRSKISIPPAPAAGTSADPSSPTDSITSSGSVPAKSRLTASSLPASTASSLGIGRSRSSSQPGRRPSLVGGRVSPLDQRPPMPATAGLNGTIMPRKPSYPSRLNPGAQPQLMVQTDPYFSSPTTPATALVPPPAMVGNLPTTPTSPLPPAPPTDALRKPYHMMNLLRNTMTSRTGGYVTRRLHVPQEVWSQGGAKLANVLEKVRVVEVLCSALEELQHSSVEYFGAGNVSSGMALGIGSVGRKEGEAWISKLEEFSSICDGVVASFGKKLGVGEGFVLKKTSGVTSWGGKLTRQFDKFTNGKNLDSPAAYVQGLTKLFSHAQLLDEHTRALTSQPVAPAYAAFPVDIRVSVDSKLKRASEFFASVVLTFVIRDLSQLLDKYAKKCEKWLAE